MATEIEIRNAIAAVASAAAPSAIVVPRDILNVQENGWLGVLEDQTTGLVRGWAIAQNGAELVEDLNGHGADYDYFFDVWQYFQYRTGDDSSNSEDEASAEREAVMLAFATRELFSEPLKTTLNGINPLRFPQGNIGTADISNFHGQVRLARGILSVRNRLGCN